MGLIGAVHAGLARLGGTRLHVLIVETPGSLAVRAAVERGCAERGWVSALTPADADALVVCGAPHRAIADAVERLWSSLPGPRVRAQVGTVAGVQNSLDGVATGYRAWDAAADPGASPQPEGAGDADAGDGDAGDGDAGDADDMAGMDMGGMEMDMSGPGGIPLAPGADDRDGLEMDVLHLPLGPVLAGWPPGLTLTVTLQGDVIVEVDVRDLEPALASNSEANVASNATAHRLDAAAQLLALAGAGTLAQRAARARDAQLGLVPVGPDAAALRRSVERSWVLRRALRHVGPITDPDRHGWPAAWVGDAYDRLLRLLAPVPKDARDVAGVDAEIMSAALPQLLSGSELADARLTVASLWSLAAISASTRRDGVLA